MSFQLLLYANVFNTLHEFLTTMIEIAPYYLETKMFTTCILHGKVRTCVRHAALATVQTHTYHVIHVYTGGPY